MLSLIKSLLLNFRLLDAVDIILMGMIVYWMLVILKGTRALYMLIGLSFGILGIWISSIFNIVAMNWVFTVFFSNLPLLIIVIFQNEIKRALVQAGQRSFFSRNKHLDNYVIDELVKTCLALSKKKIGALMIIEEEGVDISGYVEDGHVIDAKLSKELVISIFTPSTPMHDGAMTIKGDKVTRAGCFLPLTMNPKVSKSLGTRHRAALGITELVNLIAIVVSEESGAISIVHEGTIIRNLDSNSLKKHLSDYSYHQDSIRRTNEGYDEK